MKTSRSAYKLGKVEEWKSSGLSIGAFAKKNGFSKTGFDYWVKKSRKFRPPDPGTNYNVVILKTSVKSEPGKTVSVSFNRLHIFSNAWLSLGVARLYNLTDKVLLL